MILVAILLVLATLAGVVTGFRLGWRRGHGAGSAESNAFWLRRISEATRRKQ